MNTLYIAEKPSLATSIAKYLGGFTKSKTAFEKGDTKVDAYFNDDTIWMSRKSICELYQLSKSSISEHISNIYKDGELSTESTVRKFRTVQLEGTRRNF